MRRIARYYYQVNADIWNGLVTGFRELYRRGWLRWALVAIGEAWLVLGLLSAR